MTPRPGGLRFKQCLSALEPRPTDSSPMRWVALTPPTPGEAVGSGKDRSGLVDVGGAGGRGVGWEGIPGRVNGTCQGAHEVRRPQGLCGGSRQRYGELGAVGGAGPRPAPEGLSVPTSGARACAAVGGRRTPAIF